MINFVLMKKWEYLCAYYEKVIHEDIINEIGNDGWELVSVFEINRDNNRWIFKREVIEKAIPGEGD